MIDNAPETTVLAALEALRRRAQWVAFLRALLRTTFWGLLLCLPLTLLPSPFAAPALGLALSLILIAAGVWSVSVTPSDLALAKAYDDHHGLKDRLTTALDLLSKRDPAAGALVADAARALEHFQPEGPFPLRVPREGRLVALPLLLLVAALLLPAAARRAEAQDPALAAALTDQADRIRAFASQTSADAGPGQRERLERLEEFAAKLRQKKRKKDALAEFTQLLDQLKKDQEQLKLEQEKLRRKVKNFDQNQQHKDLVDDIHRGDYQAAANRIKKLIDELKEKRRKLQKKGKEGLEELKKLEEELKKLQDVEAKLLRLMALRRDLAQSGEVIDFLENIEGELGDLEDPEVTEGEFKRMGKLLPPGQQGNKRKIRRVKRRLTKPQNRAGSDTAEEWMSKDAQRSEHERQEQKQKIREGKGQSSFTQTRIANDGSRSGVEAKKVLQASKRAAEDTIQRQEVPAGYREYLRRYFDGLQPDQGEQK